MWTESLTEGLLADYEAAHNTLIAASDGEAVPSEDDVKGLWNVNKYGDKTGSRNHHTVNSCFLCLCGTSPVSQEKFHEWDLVMYRKYLCSLNYPNLCFAFLHDTTSRDTWMCHYSNDATAVDVSLTDPELTY